MCNSFILLLDPWLVGSVCPSILLVFYKFCQGTTNLYKVVCDRWTKNRGFLIYSKIWSLICTEFMIYWKFILFAVILHKSHIWENFLRKSFWGRPKCYQPIRLQDFFNQPYPQNKSVKWPDFLHVDTNSHKLKVDPNILG